MANGSSWGTQGGYGGPGAGGGSYQPGGKKPGMYVAEKDERVNHWTYYIAYVLIGFCLLNAVLGGGNVLSLLIRAAGLAVLEATLIKTHGTLDMYMWPAIGMVIFMVGAALGLLTGGLAYLLYIAPIVTIILMIVNADYSKKRLFGLISGVLIIVLNVVVSMISLYTSAFGIGSLLLKVARAAGLNIGGAGGVAAGAAIVYGLIQLFNPVGLMGIATLLMFVKDVGIYSGNNTSGVNQPTKPTYGNGGNYGGGFGGGNYGGGSSFGGGKGGWGK